MEENEVREVGRDQVQVLCEWDAAVAADGDDDIDADGEGDKDADGEDADAEDNHGEAI